MHAPLDPDRRASVVASRQHGALSLVQATGAGLSQRQVDGRVTAGRWVRAARGVYTVAGSRDSWLQRAWVAVLANHGRGQLSHLTAAALGGLLQPSPLPHVTVPRGSATRCGVALVHRGEVAPVDRATVDGLPTTSVSRTIVDLAGMLDAPGLDAVVDDALCRKLATPQSVLAAAGRVGGGRKGLGQLRSALTVWTEAIEPGSVAEVRLLRLVAELGCATPVTQCEVVEPGTDFVARLDLAWPARRRALEYDGVLVHNPRAWGRDEPRYQRLRQLGWEVESVTKLDLLPGEPRLRDLLRRWEL